MCRGSEGPTKEPLASAGISENSKGQLEFSLIRDDGGLGRVFDNAYNKAGGSTSGCVQEFARERTWWRPARVGMKALSVRVGMMAPCSGVCVRVPGSGFGMMVACSGVCMLAPCSGLAQWLTAWGLV